MIGFICLLQVDKAVNPAKMGQPQEDKPTKQEYEVAKFLRAQLPPKKTTLLGHKVDYFIGKKVSQSLINVCWLIIMDSV